ncbi:hypothetical protein LguiA_029484 [Lonicera macranthoides]
MSAFCDASFDCANSEAAVGCVLFHSTGTLLDGIRKKVLASSALVAEALAIKEVCRMVHMRNLSNISIASDCKVVISILSFDLKPPWEIKAILADIKELVSARNIN